MNIFLTGGTGFIGSHFLAQALQAGHHVKAIRRAGRGARVPLSREPMWLDGALGADWSGPLDGCDALVHLAAVGVSPQKATWDELFQVNVLDSLRLWRQAADAGVKRFVICGSCMEYGRSGDRYPAIPPDAPLEPVTAYGAAKAASSMAALALAAERKLELLVSRPFSIFGEGQHEGNLWPSLRKAALGGADFPMTPGEQVRDFVPVEAVAKTFLAALDRTDLRAGIPRVENAGTGKPQTLRAFAEHWWRHWNARGNLRIGALPYRDNEVMRFVPQI